MHDTHPLTAAIYAHFSFEDQVQNLQKQIDNCWGFCKKKGWRVRYVFIEQSKTGITLDELESYQILEKVKAENLDFVVFWEVRFPKAGHIKVKRVTPPWQATRSYDSRRSMHTWEILSHGAHE